VSLTVIKVSDSDFFTLSGFTPIAYALALPCKYQITDMC
jgi:hypothetical protein